MLKKINMIFSHSAEVKISDTYVKKNNYFSSVSVII